MPYKQRGIALIIVLWSIVFLTIIATAVVTTARTEIALARNRLSRAQARAFTEAALTIAALHLNATDEKDRWYPDGQTYEWQFINQTLSIAISNEGSRIDLNTAAEPLLTKLFMAAGVPQDIAEHLAGAVVDWHDPDDNRSLNGAETDDYRAAGLPYPCKNASFTSRAELRLVLGFTPLLVSRLWDSITVHAPGQTVEMQYASPLVLAANGINEPPPIANDTSRPKGGPIYRMRMQPNAGAVQEVVFSIGGRNGAPYLILEWQ